MNAPSDKPLRRVNLNLYAEDVQTMIDRYGYGWTEQIRLLVHQDCADYHTLKGLLEEATHDH